MVDGSSMKGVILDIDGVLRRGKDVIKGSPQAVHDLKEMGLTICYLTNNSTVTRKEMLYALVAMGYPDGHMISSARTAAVFIRGEYGKSRCMALGERGLTRELELEGHSVVQAGEARGIGSILRSDWTDFKGSELNVSRVDQVVVGLDRSLTYTRMTDALWAIRAGARFIATNDDPNLPSEKGQVLPGAGTIVRPLALASGVEPLVVGKPKPYSTRLALHEMGLEPEEVLMIGDRPDTDIAAGMAAGCHVALVLTGDIKEIGKVGYPVFDDLKGLVKGLF